MARTRTFLIALIAVLLALAACSSSSTDDATSADFDDTGDFEGADDSGGEAAAPDEAADDGGGDAVSAVDVELAGAEIDRKIVYRGDIAAEVDDLTVAVRSARDEVAAEGGFVFGQQIGTSSARVVLKVPSIRFDAAFDAVASIGEVTSQSIEADDVTEQFTDLGSRRATLETSIARLQGFLAETNNVDEISRLESELTRREAERDVIAGQLRVLEDRTSFGTISVDYVVPEEAEAVVAEGESGPPGFGRGLETGWDGLVFAAGVAATAGGFLLPFVPLLLVVAGLVVWARRRRPVTVAAE